MTDTEKSAGNSEEGNTSPARTRANVRPPIEYSSPKAFGKSFAARWRSVWTKTFILSLLAGQVVSLCITCTSVTTTELVNRGWILSTTQNFFTCVYLWLPSYHVAVLLNIFARYFTLFAIYTPYTIYKCKHIHSFGDPYLCWWPYRWIFWLGETYLEGRNKVYVGCSKKICPPSFDF